MERDESVFVLGTDLFIRGGHFAQVKGVGPRFGHERVIDAPISEAAMVAAGVGRGDERDASRDRPELHRLRVRRDG